MKYVLAFVLAGVLLGPLTLSGTTASRCATGDALAFAAIRTSPTHLAGQIPSLYTGKARYFGRRYNCTGGGVEVRRLGLGLYNIRFPGLNPRVVLVSALVQEGTSASALPLGDNSIHVVLRGPGVGEDGTLTKRDVPFAIAVF